MPPGGTRRRSGRCWPQKSGSSTEQDAERGTLTRLLRAADLAGHDVEDVLRRALEGRDFAGARSVAAVLHGRVSRIIGTPEPMASGELCGPDPGDRGPGGGQVRPRAGRGDGRARVAAGEPGGDGPAGVGAAVPRRGARGSRRAGGVDRGGPGRRPPTGKNAGTPTRPRPSARRRNADHRSSGPAGTPPTPRCELPDEGREVAAATDGELWARRAAYERDTRGRRRTSLTSCGMRTSQKTPTGPTPCSPGTGPTPRRTRPNGREPCGRPGNTVRWPRKSAPTARR